jgi:hypothetical protein
LYEVREILFSDFNPVTVLISVALTWVGNKLTVSETLVRTLSSSYWPLVASIACVFEVMVPHAAT